MAKNNSSENITAVKNVSTAALQTNGLSYYLGSGREVQPSSFIVPNGSLTALTGNNGSGKSTLFKVLLALTPKLQGDVFFFGCNYEKMSPLSKRQNIAYMQQEFFIDWTFPITVYDVVEMGLYAHASFYSGLSKKNKQWAEHCLESVGLMHLKNRAIMGLSGGEKRRMFFARMLAQRADFLMLDEPFAGIDDRSEEILIDLLKKLSRAGKTIFLVHHELKMVKKFFDWVVYIKNNKIYHCTAEDWQP